MQAGLRFTAVLLLVLSLGLHWTLLQGVAWTGMILDYSRDGSFRQALSRTFDGQHPCCLCKAIEKGRADEQKQKQQKAMPGSKLDVGLVWQSTEFDFLCGRPDLLVVQQRISSRTIEPPKPRPRSIPADIPAAPIA